MIKNSNPRQARLESGGTFQVTLILLCTAVVLAVAALYHFRSGAPALPPAKGEASGDELDAARSTGKTAADEEQPAPPRSSVSVRRSQTQASPSPQSSTGPLGDDREAQKGTAVAEQAIARLSKLEVKGALTAEQAAAVKHDLQQLVAEGVGGIPAIRQFLQQNRDLSLDELKGGSSTGYPTLRAGLVDSLRQIGGPEAQGVLADTLRTTADPSEISMLARHLEELAPGQYREEAVNAARETLVQMAEGKSKADVGSLFQILQNYGDGSVLADIQKIVPNWQHYALMAMAGMPDGQGVPALIQQAQQSSGSSGNSTFALQMLAQVASQYPDAGASLVEQAKAGQIPDRAWRRIGDALSGDQYQFARDANVDAATLMRIPGTKMYHMNNDKESFYSTPLPPDAPDLTQRRALLDQLLAATSNPAATEALQRAKAALSGGGR